MPSLNSVADVRVDAEKLLLAVAANADQLQDVESNKTPLVTSLDRLKELTTRRDTLKVDSQVLSKAIQETVRQIRDDGAGLRALCRARLGVRSEKLKEFNVLPRGQGLRRSRSTGTPIPPPAPTGKPATVPQGVP